MRTEWRGVGIGFASAVALGAAFVLWQSHLFLWLAFSVGIGATVAFFLTIYATMLVAAAAGVLIALLVAFTWLLMPVVPPPTIEAFSGSSDYLDGADVYGIRWKTGLTSADISIENNTKHSYEDLDILISTNLAIYGVGSKQDGNQCIISPSYGIVKVMSAFIIHSDGDGRMISELPNLSQYYRIHCEKLIVGSMLNVTVLTPKTFFSTSGGGKREQLEWISFQTNYSMEGSQVKSPLKVICLVSSCHDIPDGNRR